MEAAVILAHNVLHNGQFIGNEIVGHEIDRIQDGYRHTWWESPSTAIQYIEIRAQNLIFNYGFEANINDWYLIEGGAGAGTMTRNTSSPISGLGDMQITTTVADNAADIVMATNFKPIFMRGGRTYRVMLRTLAVGAAKNIRWGFLDENYAESGTLYTAGATVNTGAGHSHDITPVTDGWYHPYVRMESVGTVFFDDFVCNELRDVDTLCIDEGHTLANATIQVQYRANEFAGWSVALAPFNHQNSQPVYKTFTAQTALSWRLTFTVLTVVPDIPVAQVPMLHLGEGWTMPHQFVGSFDPFENRKNTNIVTSERGIRQDTFKFNQRVFKALMPVITPTEYLELEYFYEDTENGLHPFFFIWKPTTTVWDVMPMLNKRGELAPYAWYNRRQWTLDAEEVVGKRKI